jgi:TolA-binding protein
MALAFLLTVFRSPVVLGQGQNESGLVMSVDSLLQKFSLDELARFREFYRNEVNAEKTENQLLQNMGIQDGEKIYAINPANPYMDKILFRLAEFSYTKEKDDLFARMSDYEKEFDKFDAGERPEPPEEPKPDFSDAIDTYKLVIADFPNSGLRDDALYQLGFTLEENFQEEEALAYYEMVIDDYSDSRYMPEALIRLGEYHFDPIHRDLDKAIHYFGRVMDFRTTPRYDEALYKLGWSHYLREEYSSAIAMFTLLVEDIEKYQEIDKDGEFTNPVLREEALEYIGVCFRDQGGLPAALAYLDEKGRPAYGAEILTKMGDVYRENDEKFVQAMFSYEALLARYPLDLNAAEFQEKIVLCAKGLKDNEEIYLARQKLFDTYRPDGEWQKRIEELDLVPYDRLMALRQATEKSEAAQRDNVNLLIRLGEEKLDASYYVLSVQEAKKYLEQFPYDTSAYAIHWDLALILDTKLHKKEEAYREYLKVCNDYLKTDFGRIAAENAVVLARELAELADVADQPAENDSTLSLADIADIMEADALSDSSSVASLEVEPVSQAEEFLIQAYDNFIKLFPHEVETAEVLRNVGTLYYNRKDYDPALRYFNTLSARFSDSPFAHEVQFAALESYFGKKDFANAEMAAKLMQEDEELPPEIRAKVNGRLAESVYLNAEALAGEDNHLAAALKFREVFAEVPDAPFADKAIFQAGLQFDLAQELTQAIEAYQELIDNFPGSEHYLNAVNNLALDYGETGDHQQAAATYERLASIHPDTARAQDALYNAGHFYAEAEAWRDAIRVNRTYVDQYPQTPDVEDMFYGLAGFHLKLDEFEQANEIYGEFAARFPDSPRSVQTHFMRGQYFLNKGRVADALAEFDKAVARNDELGQRNLQTNDFYAAEALFAKTEEQYKEFGKVKFTLANMASAQAEKKALLQQLTRQYTDVAAYGTNRLYSATFRIGQVYEDFADTWSSQELPELSETEKIFHQKNLNNTSAQLYNRAFGSYKSGYKALLALRDSYQPTDTPAPADSSIRVVEEDSTLRVAARWIHKTGEKISETLYNVADINAASIDPLLNAPIPGGLDEVTELEYRSQVLSKAVFPVVQEVTQAYIRSLQQADWLQLENRWVAQSRSRLFEVMSVLPSRYKQLCLDATGTYLSRYDRYRQIMTEGTEEEQENTLDLAGILVNIVELSKNYATNMNESYRISIESILMQPFGNTIANSLFSDLTQTSVELAGNFKKSAADAKQMKDQFWVKNQNSPQMVYEDAIFTFTDLETYLQENALELCESTYNLKKQHGFNSTKFVQMANLLVELDPQTYAVEFELPVEDMIFTPDETWLYATNVRDAAWTLPEFDAADWQPAPVLEDFSSGEDPILLAQDLVMASLTIDSTAVDSTSGNAGHQGMPRVYALRKEVDLVDVPLKAVLKVNADDNVRVFLNGIKVFEENDESLGWGSVFETDLTLFLKSGKNLLAIELEDTDGSGHGIQPLLEMKTINHAALVENQEELLKKELGEIATMEDLIFNRNFVPEH